MMTMTGGCSSAKCTWSLNMVLEITPPRTPLCPFNGQMTTVTLGPMSCSDRWGLSVTTRPVRTSTNLADPKTGYSRSLCQIQLRQCSLAGMLRSAPKQQNGDVDEKVRVPSDPHSTRNEWPNVLRMS